MHVLASNKLLLHVCKQNYVPVGYLESYYRVSHNCVARLHTVYATDSHFSVCNIRKLEKGPGDEANA